jgi:hypothetical protein
MRYQIVVRGVLDEGWSNWLGHAEVTSTTVGAEPATMLQVDVPDQPALLGILNRLADMNVFLVSVELCTESAGG